MNFRFVVVPLVVITLVSTACVGGGSLGFIATPIPTSGTSGTPTPTVAQCAEAVTGLHIRSAPSARATVLSWLSEGDSVYVLDTSVPFWSKVRFGEIIGYARSKYLKESTCE